MSTESVTVVRSLYENFGKGDIPAVHDLDDARIIALTTISSA